MSVYSRANFPLVSAYPKNFRDRNRWILRHRGVRNVVSGQRPDAAFRERDVERRRRLNRIVEEKLGCAVRSEQD